MGRPGQDLSPKPAWGPARVTELPGLQAIPAGRLICCFNCVSADGLDRLFTVRKVSKGRRLEEGLCLLKTIPLRESHALGWGRPLHADNLSAAGAEITTSCLRLCSLDALCNTRSGLSIEHFKFADGVGFFRSQLSLYPMDSRATKSGSYDHGQCNCVPSFHDTPPLACRTPVSGGLEIILRLACDEQLKRSRHKDTGL